MYTKTEILQASMDVYGWTYDKEADKISFEDGQQVSVDIVVKHMREKIGQSFECIYDEHVSLISILKCTKCGTVIFSHDDEDYEPNLRCPVCTDYKTSFEFWTKEDVELSEEKQNTLKLYEKMNQDHIEEYERIKRRKGKYDFQLFVWKYFNKLFGLDVQITRLGGIDIEINYCIATGEIGYTTKWFLRIPISFTAWKCFFKNPKASLVIYKDVKRKYNRKDDQK